MATIDVEIVSAEDQVLSTTAREVTAKSLDGSFGILANHQPGLFALTIGEVKIFTDGADADVSVAVDNGFLYFSDNKLVVLADEAQLATDIDKAAEERRAAEYQKRINALPADDTAEREILGNRLKAAELRVRLAA